MTPVADIALRSSLVLLASLAATWGLRRHSAARRHLVLAAGIVGALAVAPIVWLGPEWTWAIAATSRPPLLDAMIETVATARDAGGSEPVRGVDWLLLVWLIGAAAAGGRLCWRLGRLAALTRRARPVQGSWARLLPEAARAMHVHRDVAVRAADRTITGIWGWHRPVLLVPVGAEDWSDERVRLVLLHELAHVRRADWLAQLTAEILRACYWFNPLASIVATALRRESERACDDLVLDAGIPAGLYGAELLAIARRQAAPTYPVPLVSMAHPSTLEGRIAAMLDRTLDRRPPSWRGAAVLLGAALAITVPAATLHLLAQGDPRGLTIQVFDPSGGVLPAVDVELEGGQDAKRSAMTDGTGRVVFQDVANGDYTLKASVAGFRTLSAALSVREPRERQRSITLQVGELEETVSVRERRRTGQAARSQAAAEPVRIGGNIKAPRRLKNVTPEYPAGMLDAGLEGVVPMEALIGTDGSVVSVRVLSADVHPEFARSAEAAVRQWQFSPTLLNGEAVDVRMRVSVRFGLQD